MREDLAGAADNYDNAIQEPILRAMPGGAELIDAFGFVPWFHDDELERLELASKGPSRLILRATIYGTHVETRTCRVTFEIAEIVELMLMHFHKQNPLFSLRLRPAGPLLGPIYGAEPSSEDIEIAIEPALGIEGVIRCRGVSVALHDLRTKPSKLNSGEWP